MRYAAPSGITRTSSSTAIISDPRVLLTISSFGFSTVTCPIVDWSLFARIVAEATRRAKAFELAVEKIAEALTRGAGGLARAWGNAAPLAPERSRRAGPVRT